MTFKEIGLQVKSSYLSVTILILTIILITDVVLLGNGKLLEVFLGFNFRKIVFILLSISLILYFYINRDVREQVDYSLVILPIIAFFVWSVFIPLLYGQVFDYKYTGNYDATLSNFHKPNSLNDFIFILTLSFKESLVLLAFSMLPLISVFYRNNSKLWQYVKTLFFIAIFFLILIHLYFDKKILGCYLANDSICSSLTLAYKIYDARGEMALNLLRPYLDANSNELIYRPIRFSFVSSIFMGIIAIYPLFIRDKKFANPLIYCSVIFFLIIAVFFTGLRGLLLAAIFGTAIFMLLNSYLINLYKNIYRLVFITIALSVILVLASSSSDILSYFGLQRIGSDSIRYNQGWVLINEILKYPVFGKGFGSVIENYQRLFSFEQYMLALIMKVGIVGLLLFYFYMKKWIFNFQIRDVSSFSEHEKRRYIGNTIGIISLFVLSSTNPYLMNFVGFVFILFFVVDHSVLTFKRN